MLILPAGPDDCGALADTSRRGFEADVNVGAPAVGGPPGYDSPEWHAEATRWGQVFTIAERDGVVVGGAILALQTPTAARLERVWLVPEAQNRGLGRRVMTGLEALFPGVTRWTLDTPAWNIRNHHFYARCGYRLIGSTGDDGLRFEKVVPPAGPPLGSTAAVPQ